MSEDAPLMKLDVEMSADRFNVGGDVELALVLTNVAPDDLWVNERLLVNSAHAPAPFREIWVDLQGPGAKRLNFTRKIRAGFADPQHYVVLGPGRSVKTSLNLARYFDLTVEGGYALIVSYQDGNPEPPQAPSGARHFAGKVRSDLIEFRVVAGATE